MTTSRQPPPSVRRAGDWSIFRRKDVFCEKTSAENMDLSPSSPRGYTLVEMLIILAVLVLMAGVAWPVLRAPWRRTQVEDAANHARVTLARVRVKAIESGTAWQFCFLPGTGLFAYRPVVPGRDARRMAEAGPSQDSLDEETVEGELPHGVFFRDPRERETFNSLDTSDAAPLPAEEISRLDAADWSEPILFYPNGRAANARLELQGPKGLSVDVTLRGLTGMAKVGKLQRPRPQEEPQQEPRE
ncbi:MAG: prepilin-type N-terminal cleavage/methylation domain-containing protein [Planctomycetia bacterium]|nr:prepilin-type N-terminal cleavage/methylation domain-containing protein [Planctomycetia bacterium]